MEYYIRLMVPRMCRVMNKRQYKKTKPLGKSPAMRIDWAKGESYSVKAYWENGKFIRSERV